MGQLPPLNGIPISYFLTNCLKTASFVSVCVFNCSILINIRCLDSCGSLGGGISNVLGLMPKIPNLSLCMASKVGHRDVKLEHIVMAWLRKSCAIITDVFAVILNCYHHCNTFTFGNNEKQDLIQVQAQWLTAHLGIFLFYSSVWQLCRV